MVLTCFAVLQSAVAPGAAAVAATSNIPLFGRKYKARLVLILIYKRSLYFRPKRYCIGTEKSVARVVSNSFLQSRLLCSHTQQSCVLGETAGGVGAAHAACSYRHIYIA